MARKTITQKSSDNPYFHRDFHIALNYGIDYLHKKFGAKAVKEYLAQFANNYHVTLKQKRKNNNGNEKRIVQKNQRCQINEKLSLRQRY